VVAVETSQVLVAPRAQLETIALKDPTLGRELGRFCHDRMVSNLMRHSALLSAIEPKKRSAVVGFFSSQSFQAGEVLVREGEEADRIFLLASGGVEVRGTDADGDRVVLAQIGPGDVVGEISMVLRRPATADVVAVHATVALALTQERFRAAIKEHLPLLGVLYELATRREEETRAAVAGDTLDASDVVLV
jgi:CRP-like cAMP-binding protein